MLVEYESNHKICLNWPYTHDLFLPTVIAPCAQVGYRFTDMMCTCHCKFSVHTFLNTWTGQKCRSVYRAFSFLSENLSISRPIGTKLPWRAEHKPQQSQGEFVTIVWIWQTVSLLSIRPRCGIVASHRFESCSDVSTPWNCLPIPRVIPTACGDQQYVAI